MKDEFIDFQIQMYLEKGMVGFPRAAATSVVDILALMDKGSLVPHRCHAEPRIHRRSRTYRPTAAGVCGEDDHITIRNRALAYQRFWIRRLFQIQGETANADVQPAPPSNPVPVGTETI